MKTIPENQNNILSSFNQHQNCIKSNNKEWEQKSYDRIIEILLDVLPHGSGIDCKWEFDVTDKYVYCTNSFHVMNDNGMYCGYIDFTVKINGIYRDYNGGVLFSITGSFGKNKDIKDYLYECINAAFETL